MNLFCAGFRRSAKAACVREACRSRVGFPADELQQQRAGHRAGQDHDKIAIRRERHRDHAKRRLGPDVVCQIYIVAVSIRKAQKRGDRFCPLQTKCRKEPIACKEEQDTERRTRIVLQQHVKIIPKRIRRRRLQKAVKQDPCRVENDGGHRKDDQRRPKACGTASRPPVRRQICNDIAKQPRGVELADDAVQNGLDNDAKQRGFGDKAHG